MRTITDINKLCGIKILKNRWYYLVTEGNNMGNFHWLFRSNTNKSTATFYDRCIDIDDNRYYEYDGRITSNDRIVHIRPATSDEVLKYFPNESF